METLAKESPARWEPGRSSDVRSSPRRRTLARVRLFLDSPALTALVSEAGFARAHAFHAFGSPPTAILIRAET